MESAWSQRLWPCVSVTPRAARSIGRESGTERASRSSFRLRDLVDPAAQKLFLPIK